MSEQAKHTAEPWRPDFSETINVRDGDGGRLAILTNLRGPHGMGGRRDASEVSANAERVCACVNAMAGLSNEQVTALRASHAELKDSLQCTLFFARLKWGNLDADANKVFAAADAVLAAAKEL